MNVENPLDARRKRLLWRAGHRGTREMDLVLGGFARAHVAAMDACALDALEAVIDIPDADLANWILARNPVPPDRRSPMLEALLAFRP